MMKSENREELTQIFERFVEYMNPDWREDPDMVDTPERLTRMYQHFFRNEDPSPHLSKRFPTNNEELIIIKDIECYGMCPHHFLPVIYNVSIGYVPNGWALGLSKFARISKALSSYPKLQENFTTEIAEVIYEGLKPKGVIAVVKGEHGCLRCRGVEANNKVLSSAVKGEIFADRYNRKDFYDMLKSI